MTTRENSWQGSFPSPSTDTRPRSDSIWLLKKLEQIVSPKKTGFTRKFWPQKNLTSPKYLIRRMDSFLVKIHFVWDMWQLGEFATNSFCKSRHMAAFRSFVTTWGSLLFLPCFPLPCQYYWAAMVVCGIINIWWTTRHGQHARMGRF